MKVNGREGKGGGGKENQGRKNRLTLVDILLQIPQRDIQQLLLKRRNLPNLVHLLHTILAQRDLARKVIYSAVLVQRTVYKRWLHHPLGPVLGLEQTLREPRARHRHRQGRGPGAVFGFDDLVTPELHAVDEIVEIFAFERVTRLRQQRDNGRARVTADYGDVLVSRVGGFVLRDEPGGSDDVEGGDAEEFGRLVDGAGFEDFGADGDGRVDLSPELGKTG